MTLSAWWLEVPLHQQSAAQWSSPQRVWWKEGIPAFSLGPSRPSGLGVGGWAGGPGDRLRAVSCRAPEPLPRLTTGRPLAGPSPWSSSERLSHPHLRDLMAAAASMGCSPWRPQQLEYTDTAIKVTASTSFSLSVQVAKLGTRRRWPEVRVKLQGHCTSLFQAHLCGRGCCQRAVVSSELTWLVFATTCIPINPIQMALSRLSEKPEGRLGPGHLLPQCWCLGRVWGPGPEGAVSWNLPLQWAWALAGGPKLDECSWAG